MPQQQFIENIKVLKVIYNKTYKDLASDLGIKVTTIQSWLDGRDIYPKADLLKKVSDFFKVSIDWLFIEKIATYTKQEILDNYNYVQSRLKN